MYLTTDLVYYNAHSSFQQGQPRRQQPQHDQHRLLQVVRMPEVDPGVGRGLDVAALPDASQKCGLPVLPLRLFWHRPGEQLTIMQCFLNLYYVCFSGSATAKARFSTSCSCHYGVTAPHDFFTAEKLTQVVNMFRSFIVLVVVWSTSITKDLRLQWSFIILAIVKMSSNVLSDRGTDFEDALPRSWTEQPSHLHVAHHSREFLSLQF